MQETPTSVPTLNLPERSRAKYEKAYERFVDWCTQKNIKNDLSEAVVLSYFQHLANFQKSSSLWACFSMLRAMISLKKKVDISKYSSLSALLKSKAKGYKPKKSKILTREDITRFLLEAEDGKFLLTKVALIIGIAGACRKEELTNLLAENVKDEGLVFHIIIPNAKTKVSRDFFVTSGNIDGLNMVETVRKYVAMRPDVDHRRFFLGFRYGKCIKQPVGIHTFGGMPKKIAMFLQLPTPEEYTGHCFRRSAKSLHAEYGSSFFAVKRHRAAEQRCAASAKVKNE